MKQAFYRLSVIFPFILFLGLTACNEPSSMSNNYQPVQQHSPPVNSDYYFNVFGDPQNGKAVYSHLVAVALTGANPAFTVIVGDMISSPTEVEQWPAFKAVSTPLMAKGDFWVVIGNHDIEDRNSLETLRTYYPDVPESGYYARQNNGIYNIFLNSQEFDTDKITETQLDWLEQQLMHEGASRGRIPIVYSHRPPFPQNRHKDEPFQDNEAIHELLLHYNVRLMISGHEHNYSRYERDGVTYLITGGAGAALYTEAGDNTFYHFTRIFVGDGFLTVRIIGVFGKKYDEFKIIL
ncbi:metallophosphoesterase [bacterium]|nr:metallophosphoesterase [bacterium]